MEPTAALVEEIEKLATYNLTVGWTFFEGDQDIPETYKSAVKEAIVKATKRFSWKKGDLMIIDNKQVMHGRENYNDENRKIAVSFS